MNPRLRTWLQLFRAPNLFTVPGDPVSGFLLANFGVLTIEALYVIGASLCFYAAGLLDNDLADLTEDREERPGRPLPSGAASTGMVRMVALALIAVGLGLCALVGTTTLVAGGAIVIAVVLYNHGVKRLPVLGALNMGLCRTLSVILGASAAPAGAIAKEAIVAAGLIGLYIAAITNLARFETRAGSPLPAKWLPALMLLGGLVAAWTWVPMGTRETLLLSTIAFRGLLITAICLSAWIAFSLSRGGCPLPPAIGRFIRLLLLLQAAFCAYSGAVGLILAGFFLILYPISRAVGKRFYAS